MDEINKVEEFFNQLKEFNQKRKERVRTLRLIEVWNFLSEERKQEFAEQILNLAEGYERCQKNDNIQKECQRNGHKYSEWNKSNYSGQDTWYRTCKSCGYIERTDKNPLQNKVIKRSIFRRKPF